MATNATLNKDGSLTLYVQGKKVWSGPASGLVAYLSGESAPALPAKKAKKEKPKSRSARWEDACNRAQEALSELVDIQGEFQDWKDNLPENLQQSALGEKLDAVCDLSVQDALDTVEEAAGADLPLGFGRD